MIVKEMGKKFIEFPPFDLDKAFHDSNVHAPIIFILSPGADPRYELNNFAEKMTFKSHLTGRSLG